MKRTNYVWLGAVVIMMALPVFVSAQWYRGNVRETLKRLEEDSDRFTKSLDSDLDHSRINGTRTEDEINRYVHDFEEATDHLKDRYEDQGTAPGLAREVLIRGQRIDRFMKQYRPGVRSMSDLARVRSSLDRLAWAYRIAWRW